MNRKVSQPFLLLDCFCRSWSQHYEGETYSKSPAEFKLAKEYLELNEAWNADDITARAKIYLSKNGFYAENRHSFRAFISNIGTFVEAPIPRKPSDPELNHVCKNGHETKYLRSVWERGRNRSMKCPVEGCEERIIVNNVLAQIPDITQFIPICPKEGR